MTRLYVNYFNIFKKVFYKFLQQRAKNHGASRAQICCYFTFIPVYLQLHSRVSLKALLHFLENNVAHQQFRQLGKFVAKSGNFSTHSPLRLLFFSNVKSD